MSWNIHIYAEYTTPESDTWTPLFDSAIYSNYRKYCDEFYYSMNRIPVENVSCIGIKSCQTIKRFSTITCLAVAY